MTERLHCRGPDGVKVEAWDDVVLGHARLAIIDLETGEQPQTNADGTVVVSVNGEIYNYIELRSDLEARGHVFRTKSDVEVIPHLYDEYGEAFLDHLRGMFAIALFDSRRKTLLLVRDRLGKKPIYWTQTSEGFYFASEMKALLEVPSVGKAMDPRAVEDFLTFQYIPSPGTVFKDVHKIPAASWLRIRDGQVEEGEYWTPGFEIDHAMTEESAIEQVREVLDESVRIRLRSDVPLGAFLSGGIDSNLIVSSAVRQSVGELRTTTIAFARSNEDEVAMARQVAGQLGTNHVEKNVDSNVVEVLHDVAGYLDEPLGDSSTIPTWLVSKAAREDVTVALSGDGGDETFGGYARRYYHNVFIDRLRRRARRPGQVLAGTLARMWPRSSRLPRPMRLGRVLRNLSLDAEDAYLQDMSIFRSEDKDRLYRPEFRQALDGYDAREVFERHFSSCESDDLLSRLLYVDLKTYLADGVLAKVDRMSMAHSLEVRAPFLDHRLVELAARIPSTMKLKGRRSKHILRCLASERVGEEVARAPKVGFTPPLASWLRGDLRELLVECVVEAPGVIGDFLDGQGVRRMFEEHDSGRRDHSRLLWLCLVLELWHREFGRRMDSR